MVNAGNKRDIEIAGNICDISAEAFSRRASASQFEEYRYFIAFETCPIPRKCPSRTSPVGRRRSRWFTANGYLQNFYFYFYFLFAVEILIASDEDDAASVPPFLILSGSSLCNIGKIDQLIVGSTVRSLHCKGHFQTELVGVLEQNGHVQGIEAKEACERSVCVHRLERLSYRLASVIASRCLLRGLLFVASARIYVSNRE